MQQILFAPTFAEWQRLARRALHAGWHWRDVIWQELASDQPMLNLAEADGEAASNAAVFKVPREFLEAGARIACHADEARWALLYRVLWRVTHGERHLLRVSTDADTLEWLRRDKAVRHEMHKMRAFVRFRAVEHEGATWYVAWFEPEHHVVELNAAFFVDRFAGMHWSILTPERCAHWDGKRLTFTAGVPKSEAPTEDAVEGLWLQYYSHIFNPARVKVQAMQSEMPKRYWKNLPEAAVIPALLRSAPARVETMVARSREKATLSAHVVRLEEEPPDWESLKRQVQACRACSLYCNATQAVFGEGPRNAEIMLLGEQPGDMEDLEGRPFVGPAGQLLDQALKAAGLERGELYVSNAVKHFKWEPRGKRRLHVKPNGAEIAACKPWWQAEARLVRPRTVICLGATAAAAVCGRPVKIAAERGRFFQTEWAAQTLITVHPSALLRMPDDEKGAAFEAFVADLRMAVG
jgi:DNA polymerase